MAKYEVKGKAWERMPGSVRVEDCTTSEEVMAKAKLDYRVDKCPLVAKMEINENNFDDMCDAAKDGAGFIHGKELYADCPNAFGTFRTDRKIPLGVVKSKYTVVQNANAFKFFDDAIGKDKAIFQTAGAFGYGERIFVSVKLPDIIRVNNDICENYLVFTNTHDGSSGVKILFTPIRVVCQNTLNAAIATSKNYVTFRHTANVSSKIDTAGEILGISKIKIDEASQLYNQLASIKVTDKEVMDYIANVYLTEKELENVNLITDNNIRSLFNRNFAVMEEAKISSRKVNQLVGSYDYYFKGIGQTEIAGTAWGAYNAITGYVSNVGNDDGEKRMDSLLYGTKFDINAKALSLAAS